MSSDSIPAPAAHGRANGLADGRADGFFPWAKDAARRHKVITVFLALLALVAVVGTLRLSVYMFDPARTDFSLVPGDPFLVRHSCLSAYVAGAALFERGDPNLYEASHYRPETAGHGIAIGELDQDPYQYPPFLLLPFQAVLALSRDFATIRAAFYVFECALILFSLIFVARFVGGERGYLALALLPLVWGMPPNLAALQFGNIQALVVAGAVLGMIAIEKRWIALGGGLLAVAILAKIFPVILVIYLLARRHWKALLATAGWGALLSAAVVLFGGVAPWLGFLTYQLPRLSSGEAFAELFAASPTSALINLAYSSLPYKLDALGLIEAPQISRLAATLGNLMVLAAAVVIGLYDGREDRLEKGGQGAGRRGAAEEAAAWRLGRVLGWLALLNLSTLQSTMSPHYAVFGTFWLLSLWAAGRTRSSPAQTGWLLFGAVVLLSIGVPSTAKIAVAAAVVVQLANIGYNLAVALRRLRGLPRLRSLESAP